MLKTLKNKNAEVTFDTLGVHLQSFKVNGKEYLWQRDPHYWGKTAPVLFPYIGAVPNHPVEIYGKPCKMPRHGFIKDTEMSPVLEEEDHAVYETMDTPDTMEMYPYHFLFRADYCLKGEKLVLSYTVENTDDKELIFLIGGHPAINCPMEEGEEFSDYKIVFNRKEEDKALIDGTVLPLSYDLFPVDAHVVDDVKSDKVWLVHKDTKKGIAFEFANYNMLAIWSPVGKESPFVCLEPWCNGLYETLFTDQEFSHKKHLQKLAPGEHRTYTFSIQPVSDFF